MAREKPTTGEIYHIYNRGVDKRDIFMEEVDYVRFIHDLFEFNDQNPPPNINYHLHRASSSEYSEVGLPNIEREPRKLLVELMAFCLMPNHFHLMVRQKRDGGVSDFMRKLGTGYTHYFNKKYDRSGALFQGKYKFERLATNAHFIHLPYYIHANPLDLFDKGWREKKLQNKKKALRFLKDYRWSSFPDYIGTKNFPSVTQREFLLEFSEGNSGYLENFKRWLSDVEFSAIEPIALEKL